MHPTARALPIMLAVGTMRPELEGSRRVALLAAIALILDVTVLFLPLHYRGAGVPFGSAFPATAPTRLTIGFIIANSIIPLVILGTIWLLFIARLPTVAGGVLLAAGTFSFFQGVAAPFYVHTGPQPFVLGAIRLVAGSILLVAALTLMRRRPPDLPPPPR